MSHLLVGIGLCVGLCLLFVLFVRPRPEGCGGRESCGACGKAADCTLRESDNE